MPTIAGASRQIAGKFYDRGGSWVNVKHPDFGAKGDGKTLSNGAITTGTPNFTSASNPFTSADAGKSIVVVGAGAAGVPLVTTILTYVSAGAVTLAANAGTTVSGAAVLYGTDDSAAINAAAATGLDVIVPGPAIYCAHGLSQSTTGQTFVGTGAFARIAKNANGTLFASTGDDVTVRHISFRGESASGALTGDNVTFTGARCGMVDAASQWANGRALKWTGDSFRLEGTCGIYQTVDATATGYDIEGGVLGTATLYHRIDTIITSQNTGGILLNDVGEHMLAHSQFGKLYLKCSNIGTPPTGSGGGHSSDCRILGPITVELSGASLDNIHRGTLATVTFAAGTSGCSWQETSINAGAAIVNNGNADNFILRNVSSGGFVILKVGPDSSLATIQVDLSNGQMRVPSMRIGNNVNLYFEKSTGAVSVGMNEDASGNFTLNNPESNAVNTYATAGASSRHQFQVNSVIKTVFDASGIRMGGTTAPFLVSGSGSPETVVTAIVGSRYARTDGGAGTSIYIKESGTGNTGWIAK